MVSASQLYGTPKVGGDTLSYCSRCKIELAHVIVSMIGSKPAKVICKTCKSQHNHRGLPGQKTTTRTPTGRAKTQRTTVRASTYWEQKLAENASRPHLDYNIKEEFKKDDILNHVTFGLGLVEEVRGDGKILVIFRVGEKILIHGHT